jgi:hypothetical protein
VGERLYLHAGRTHPAYGKMALVFRQLPGGAAEDATPFGLGGLLCDQKSIWHDEGACAAPVAHDPEVDQEQFVKASIWGADWRGHAGEFLATYFGDDLSKYFAPGVDGKPKRPDPAGIHADPWCRDWRSWTVEVRFAGEVDLFEALTTDALMFWAIDSQLEARLDTEVSTTGADYPFLNALLRSKARRIDDPGTGTGKLFDLVDEEVQRQCLR